MATCANCENGKLIIKLIDGELKEQCDYCGDVFEIYKKKE